MLARKLCSLGLALALVPSVTLPAHAEFLKNFKTDGSIEVKTFGIDNETDFNGTKDDYRSESRTRVLVGGSFDLLDDVHGRVLLRKNNRLYGQASENANSVQTAINVDNAYAKIDKLMDRVDLTMGRQFYGSSSDLVIYFGPQPDDLLSVTALDAFRADADIMGWAKFMGIAGKMVENTTGDATNPTYHAGTTVASGGNNSNADTDLFGGEINTDKLVPSGNVAAYYYTRKAKTPKTAPATGNNTLNVFGVRLAGDVPIVAGLGYRAEYVQDGGSNNSIAGTPGYNGSAVFLAAHYGHDMAAMPFRARIEWGRGSDDFAAIAPGQRFGIIWGEHSNAGPSTLNRGTNGFAAGLSNLNVLDIGLGINPISKLGVDLNAYRFQYDASLGGIGVSAGTEYDLILSWKHSENVSLEANAATFQVGTSLQNAPGTPTSPVTRLGADIKVKF